MSKQTSDQDDTQKNTADTGPEDKTTASSSSTNGASHSGGEDSRPTTDTPASSSSQPSTSSGRRSRRHQKNTKSASQNPAEQKAAPQSTSAESPAGGETSATSSSSAGSKPKPSTPAKDTANHNASTSSSGGKSGTPDKDTSTSGGGGKGKGGIAIVLVLLLAIAVGIVAWQGWQRLEAQQQQLADLSDRAESSASQQSVDDLAAQLESNEAARQDQLDSTASELRDEFADYRSDVDETLDNVLDQLSQEQETDERDWLHAETAYLLRVANQRLQLEGDVEGAAALLRTADQRLADADNPALTSVRREIANELAALDSVPRLDRTGVYLTLNAQQERVAGLRLAQDVEERAVTSSIEQPPTGTFQRQLARFGEELKDLVMIRHHDEALEALVTPEQESYLRQSLRLVIEQAQLALLKEEQGLYEASIDKALELLDSYYDTSREEAQRVVERLEELQQVTVEPELPDISGSQQAMADFIENRHESRQQTQEGGES
ncbi:MAG: uroporphyrin-III C-methyltransferase [Halomonas sp. HL-48]|nr:uroporphyrinogen-III C-methyltransferase [Halomonas sp. HL-48]KPQ25917.1 MAG: uroporphyrin-III C-methyltransferase [Halomonas sp. HL-48]